MLINCKTEVIWIAFVLFLVSLLAVFKPPFYHAWLLSVAVAGLPWLFALISLVVFLAGCFRAHTIAGMVELGVLLFSAVAFLLYCVPVARAFTMAGPLKKGLYEAFPEKADLQEEIQGAADPLARVAPRVNAPGPGMVQQQKREQGQEQERQFPKAFWFWRMFTGPLAKKVPFQTMCYYDAAGNDGPVLALR